MDFMTEGRKYWHSYLFHCKLERSFSICGLPEPETDEVRIRSVELKMKTKENQIVTWRRVSSAVIRMLCGSVTVNIYLLVKEVVREVKHLVIPNKYYWYISLKSIYGYFGLNYSLNFIVLSAGHFNYEHGNANRNRSLTTKTHHGYIRPWIRRTLATS